MMPRPSKLKAVTFMMTMLSLVKTTVGFSACCMRFNHQTFVKCKRTRTFNGLGSQNNDFTPPTPTTPMEQNFTVTFPSLSNLQDICRGGSIASSPFQVQEQQFRVLLYPRGGGHSSSYTALDQKVKAKQNLFAMFQRDDSLNDRVGVYLQYLPKSEEDTVDATFNLRLKGRQTLGPRFDVDWTAGMRFVAVGRGNLKDGTANDFGAHMMQSYLLEEFLGGKDSEEKLDVEVTVKLYPPTTSTINDDDEKIRSSTEGKTSLISFQDIRETKNLEAHNKENVRVGKIVVPILQHLSQRPRMFELGAYPGVEFRIMRILDPETGEDIFTSMPNADYELKPVYPLVQQLERQWPVRVNEREIPKLYTMNMYNAISALGSLFTAATGLTAAFIVSQLISFFFIPSKSMDPTLQVGDVLLVEKVTPRIFKNPNVGDVVLFNPPTPLQEIVKANGGRISDRDLFVKRVAAGSGDYVSVNAAGSVSINGVPAPGKRDLCEEEPLKLIQRYVQPVKNLEIKKDEVFVVGDCSSVSVDSRVWGPLKREDLVGKPLLRIWPIDRLGSVPEIPPSAPRVE